MPDYEICVNCKLPFVPTSPQNTTCKRDWCVKERENKKSAKHRKKTQDAIKQSGANDKNHALAGSARPFSELRGLTGTKLVNRINGMLQTNNKGWS